MGRTSKKLKWIIKMKNLKKEILEEKKRRKRKSKMKRKLKKNCLRDSSIII